MAITLSHIDYNYLLDQQKEASNSLAKIVLLSDKLETLKNIETLINANRSLNPLLDYDDRIYTQNLISNVIDSLREQLKED